MPPNRPVLDPNPNHTDLYHTQMYKSLLLRRTFVRLGVPSAERIIWYL